MSTEHRHADAETGRWHRFVLKRTPFIVVVERDPDDPNAADDIVRLWGTTKGGVAFRQSIAVTDATFSKEVEPGITEVTFPDVPDGVYSCVLDLGLDLTGREEGSYLLFEDEEIPLAEAEEAPPLEEWESFVDEGPELPDEWDEPLEIVGDFDFPTDEGGRS